MDSKDLSDSSLSAAGSSSWEGTSSLLPEGGSEEIGRLLEEFRSYLMVVAQAEFPQTLTAKLGPSDLIQQTLAKGHAQIKTFRGQSREELAGWLRQILLNQLNDAIRTYGREKRDVRREVAADSGLVHPRQASPSGEMLSREQQELLKRALDRLPESYRRVIESRYRANLSFSDLANQLQKSEEATRKLWARAVQKLQHELGIDANRQNPAR
jgi:RNA polymerase sigma-70 factor, ECF subfamily